MPVRDDRGGSSPVDPSQPARAYAAAGGVGGRSSTPPHRCAPELVATHLVTLLLVAPGAGCIEVPADVGDASAVSREGDPTSWTRRVANGVADFILGCFERRRALTATLIFTNVDHADAADQEFIATLLRRADPKVLRLCVCTDSDDLMPPLAAALGQYAKRRRPRHRAPKPFLDNIIANLSAADRDALAREYVDADGASHQALAEHVYRRLPAPDRKAMHLARAESLGQLNEPSLALGAIPFHHEQAGGDAATLLAASRSCLDMGCYDAALEWAVRGRRMLAHAPPDKTCNDLTRQMLFALLLLRRYDEVEGLCEDLLADSTDPALLAHATYAMAILNARHYEPSRRDYNAAKCWIEKSQAFTDATPASQTRAVNAAFLMNTLALVEMRKGRADTARQTLVDALALMAREAPDLYRNESAILLHNMARLEVATGRPDLAIGHLSTLLSQQPGDSSAWFDRGLIHQRAMRSCATMAAIRWGRRIRKRISTGRKRAVLNLEAGAYRRVIVPAAGLRRRAPELQDPSMRSGDLTGPHEIEHAIRLPAQMPILCTQGRRDADRDYDAASDGPPDRYRPDPPIPGPAIIATAWRLSWCNHDHARRPP